MTQKKRQLSHFLNFYVFLTVELPLGQYDGTQMTTVIDSVQYTIYSEELSEQEMAAVLSSMQVVVMK